MTTRRRTTVWVLLAALLLGGTAALLLRDDDSGSSGPAPDPGGALSVEPRPEESPSASPRARSTSALAPPAATTSDVAAKSSAGAPIEPSPPAPDPERVNATEAAPDAGRASAADAPDSAEGVTLVVTVVDDETGAPVARQPVELRRGYERVDSVPRTDERGRATLTAMRPGPYRLWCSRDGYAGVALDERVIPVASGGIDVEIVARHLRQGLHVRLLRGPTISGRVVDADERPVAAAVVASLSGYHEWRRTSGDDGRFRITGLGVHLPATLKVVARGGASTSGEVAVTLTSEAYEAGIVIRVGPSCTLEGIVLGPDGAPSRSATVEAHPPGRDARELRSEFEGQWGGWVATAITGADGRFRLEGLAPGRVDLQAGAQGLLVELRRGVLARPGVASVGEIRLRAGFSLRGRVVDARGAAVTDSFQVCAISKESGHSAATRIDDLGAFQLSGLLDARYEILLRGDSFNAISPRKIEARSGEEVVFVVPDQFRVVLKVETEAGRPAVDKVEAYLEFPDGAEGGRGGFLEPDGTVEFGRIPLGTRRIQIMFPEYPYVTLERPAPGPDGVCRVTVRCAGGVTVRGRVVDERGRPLVGADIRTSLSAGMSPELLRVRRTDEEGRFLLPNVPPGALFVRVEAMEVGVDDKLLALREGAAGPFTVARDVEVDVDEIVARPVPVPSREGEQPTGTASPAR